MESIDENALGLVRRAGCDHCGAAVGVAHAGTCFMRICLGCGLHYSRCDGGHDQGQATWTGFMPGLVDAVRFGFAVRWAEGDDDLPGQWVRCKPGEPGWGPDLRRLHHETRWDAQAGQWVRQRAVLYARGNNPDAIEQQQQALAAWAEEQQFDVVGSYFDVKLTAYRKGGETAVAWHDAVARVAAGDAEVVMIADLSRLSRKAEDAIEKVRQVQAAGGDLVVGFRGGPKLTLLDVQVMAQLSTTFNRGERIASVDAQQAAVRAAAEQSGLPVPVYFDADAAPSPFDQTQADAEPDEPREEQ